MESVHTCLLYWSKSHKLAGMPEFFSANKKKSSLVTNDFQNSLIVLALMVSGSP